MNPKMFSHDAMGTNWQVSVWDDVSAERLEGLRESTAKILDNFDATFSRFIESSLVWEIAKSPGVHEVPPDFILMLEMYLDLFTRTQGKINPLIGFTISDLGYDADYSLVPKSHVRATPNLLEKVKILDGSHIETRENILFDFGAIGKGYAVDLVSRLVEKEGIERFLVNGSGDIFYQGGEEIAVGLEHPHDATKVIGTVRMATGALCASGINRRSWDKYSHVIDPHTNTSPTEIVATWVFADSTASADGIASALFFVPPEVFVDRAIQYVVMNREGKVKFSDGLKLELF